MTMKGYELNCHWDGYYGEEIYFSGVIELDDVVIDAVDDEWRSNFYSHLETPTDIAEHIAFNIIVNDAELSDLDGFADQPNDFARIL